LPFRFVIGGIIMDERSNDDNNKNNDDTGTSGRDSIGDSNAAESIRELVDLQAFVLGLIGTSAGDANQNRPGKGVATNNHNADTRGRNSSGDSKTTGTVLKQIELHAFFLGLVGDGAVTGDANPNREVDAGANTPAGRGRSLRAMAGASPETQQLIDNVVGTLRRSHQMESKCVKFFRQLLSSASEEKQRRWTNKDEPVIKAVVESGAVRDLVGIMGRQDDDTSEQAAWALIRLVDAGEKMPIRHAIEVGVLPKFVVLLESPSVEIRKETARVLGVMAKTHWRPLWDNGAVDAMITLMQRDDDDEVIRNATCAVAYVCVHELDEDRILSVAPTVSQLLYYPDVKVLEQACWALHRCLCDASHQTMIRMGVCRRLVELLRHKYPPRVQLCVTICVGQFVFATSRG
jgi:Armadillo/beta-catenin-like repeat